MDDTPTGVVNVEIFGQQYPIRSQLDQVYVLKLARYLDRKMQAAAEQVHGGDSVRVAVLAALNIADEHFKTQDAGGRRAGPRRRFRDASAVLAALNIADEHGQDDWRPRRTVVAWTRSGFALEARAAGRRRAGAVLGVPRR